jgi:hypothetical protein
MLVEIKKHELTAIAQIVINLRAMAAVLLPHDDPQLIKINVWANVVDEVLERAYEQENIR